MALPALTIMPLHALFDDHDHDVRNVANLLPTPYVRGLPATLVVPLDARALSDGRENLNTYFRSEEARISAGCPQNSRKFAQLHAMIMTVLAEPSLGMEADASGADAASGKMERDVQVFTPPEHNGQPSNTVPRTDMYIETLRNAAGGTVGYRYVYVFLDQSFDINRGFDNLIRRNELRRIKRMEKRKTNSEDLRSASQILAEEVCSRDQFIQAVLQPLLNIPFNARCRSEELVAVSNEANLFKCFTWEHAFSPRLSPPGVCAAQMQLASYRPGQPGGAVQYCFPLGARRVCVDMQHPEVQLMLRLYEDTASMEEFNGLPPAEVRSRIVDKLYEARTNPILVVKERTLEDAMDRVLKLNEADLRVCATPLDRRRAREGIVMAERFRTFCVPGADISPTVNTVLVWGESERRKAEAVGEQWVPVKTQAEIVDPMLDYFANMIVRNMTALEHLMGVSANHEEVLLAMAARLSVYERAYDLKFNVLLTGPGATGKSYIQQLIVAFSIPGTYAEISHQTLKANDTEIDNNGKLIFRDELPPVFFQTGTGDPGLKEELSRGVKEVVMIHITEGGKRLQVKTIAKVQTVTMASTNEPSSNVGEAMRTRFFVRTVPQWQARDGHELIDYKLSLEAAEMNPAGRDMRVAFLYEQKFIQYVACIIYTKVFIKQMVAPDMSICLNLYRIYQNLLAKKGIQVGKRDVDRFSRFAQSLTIWHSIHMVFYSGRVVPIGTPFAMEQVQLCQYFMSSTEQITVYTLTQLSDMFVHPQMDMVIRTLGQLLCDYPNKHAVEGVRWYTKPTEMGDLLGAPADYNYLKPNCAYSITTSPLSTLAAAVVQALNASNLTKISNEIALDILMSLQNRTMPVECVYGPAGERMAVDDGTTRRILEVTVDLKVKLLRQFVDSAYDRAESDGVVISVVRDSFHPHTPEQRLVLGTAMRHGQRFYPQFLETLDSAPGTKHMFIENQKHTDLVMQYVFMPRVSADMYTDATFGLQVTPRRECVDCDVEDYLFERYAARLGIEPGERWYDFALPSTLREHPIKDPLNVHLPVNIYPERLIDIVVAQDDDTTAGFCSQQRSRPAAPATLPPPPSRRQLLLRQARDEPESRSNSSFMRTHVNRLYNRGSAIVEMGEAEEGGSTTTGRRRRS
jgi:hypothetical protein